MNAQLVEQSPISSRLCIYLTHTKNPDIALLNTICSGISSATRTPLQHLLQLCTTADLSKSYLTFFIVTSQTSVRATHSNPRETDMSLRRSHTSALDSVSPDTEIIYLLAKLCLLKKKKKRKVFDRTLNSARCTF